MIICAEVTGTADQITQGDPDESVTAGSTLPGTGTHCAKDRRNKLLRKLVFSIGELRMGVFTGLENSATQ